MDRPVEVDLQALANFAWELEGQIEALRPPADRLAALASAKLPHGDFAEAHLLGERYRVAAQDMRTLLEKLRQAIGFADVVTRAVADGYRELDQRLAAEIRGSAYYSSQYSSSQYTQFGR